MSNITQPKWEIGTRVRLTPTGDMFGTTGFTGTVAMDMGSGFAQVNFDESQPYAEAFRAKFAKAFEREGMGSRISGGVFPPGDMTPLTMSKETQPNKWGLRGYKTFRGDETPAFNSTLTLNGQAVGTVDEDGNGGEHSYNFFTKTAEALFEADAATWAEEETKRTGQNERHFAKDSFFDLLITELEFAKATASNAKAGYGITLYCEGGEKQFGHYTKGWVVGLKTEDAIKDYVAKHSEIKEWKIVGRMTPTPPKVEIRKGGYYTRRSATSGRRTKPKWEDDPKGPQWGRFENGALVKIGKTREEVA